MVKKFFYSQILYLLHDVCRAVLQLFADVLLPVLDNHSSLLPVHLSSAQVVSFAFGFVVDAKIADAGRRVGGQYNITNHRFKPIATVAILVNDRTKAEEIVAVSRYRETKRNMSGTSEHI